MGFWFHGLLGLASFLSILNQIAGTVPRGVEIDPRLGAAALRAPAASKEDFHPQAILKLQPRNSFDYRVRYEPQLRQTLLDN